VSEFNADYVIYYLQFIPVSIFISSNFDPIAIFAIRFYPHISLKSSINSIMNQKFTIVEWNHLKFALKQNFPQLTKADLEWRDGNTKDILWLISLKVGKSRKELMAIIEQEN